MTDNARPQARRPEATAFSDIDFGQPEAEHDGDAISSAFYETANWSTVTSNQGLPFIIGRKGAGKSAIAARMEILAAGSITCSFMRIMPSDFRHVEVRQLLSCLVNKDASWQYIYNKVWEGIILGQLIRHFDDNPDKYPDYGFSDRVLAEIDQFRSKCDFYLNSLDDALIDVLANYVQKVKKKTDALRLFELRKMLQPFNWTTLIDALVDEFERNAAIPSSLSIAVDGLDEHWDTSEASLFFLAELLAVAKHFTSRFGASVSFIVCLRDSIFRALVDTKSIEYDKMESFIINLEWDSRSLFGLVAKRATRNSTQEVAISEFRNLLPESISGIGIDDYLGRHILPRPRDYINFFRMLQAACGAQSRPGESHIRDVVSKYCANRLVDLENEFGLTYPGIAVCIAGLGGLPSVFDKETLLCELDRLCKDSEFRKEAPGLVAYYSMPVILARILVSIGAIGLYDVSADALRFVHEFSESRVASIWDSSNFFGVHPVYSYKGPKDIDPVSRGKNEPAIVTQPSDYLPSRESPDDLESFEIKHSRRLTELLADLTGISHGQQHFRKFEKWVRKVLETCFIGDIHNADEQITILGGSKRFEMIFDIISSLPPWEEIKSRFATHRLLVECKNTEVPTDDDFSKLIRDLDSLDLNVAFLVFRSCKREPEGKIVEHLRSRYINSQRKKIIVAITETFLTQCLRKKNLEKCRQNLNKLWRDHTERWLVS